LPAENGKRRKREKEGGGKGGYTVFPVIAFPAKKRGGKKKRNEKYKTKWKGEKRKLELDAPKGKAKKKTSRGKPGKGGEESGSRFIAAYPLEGRRFFVKEKGGKKRNRC